MRRSVMFLSGILSLLITMFFACSQDGKDKGPQYGTAPAGTYVKEYHFAVHSLHNPAKMMDAYQPLMDYMNQRLGSVRLILETSRDYPAFEEKYKTRKPDFILPNPWQTLQAMKTGYLVVAMAGEPKDFRGIFIVRRDSALRQPSDLKGKAVSYPAATALAACIMPQYFLHKNGININRDIKNLYVGSQESSIMNAYMGTAAAGATWPTPWRAFQREHPVEARDLKVMWETEPLINNSVMVRDDLPVELREKVLSLITGLHESDEGRAILRNMEISRFISAENTDYAPVRSYVERFEREVRKVELK